MYSEILLEPELFKNYSLWNGENALKSLNRINIFIGGNNSGKSRFLRTLFAKEIQYRIPEIDFEKLTQLFNEKRNTFSEFLNDTRRSSNWDSLMQKIIAEGNIEYIKDYDILTNIFESISSLSNTDTKSYANNFLYKINAYSKDVENRIKQEIDGKENINREHFRIYIPTLRGLIPTQSHGDTKFDNLKDNYLQRSKFDYFKGDTDFSKRQIYTGLNLYNDTKELLLGDTQSRDRIKHYEDFLSTQFFHRQPVNIVPRVKDDVVYIKIGKDEYPIHQLGDGIQSIIVLTYPLFFNQDKRLVVFIEEPETHLHPGLQRQFIDALLRPEFEKCQFYFTTHSNHFLDITLDYDNISVYTFYRDSKKEETPHFIIENVNSADNKTLELIGVKNSSVFLSNCTIWVEGITDRLYLRHYLHLYQKKHNKKLFREDTHYSFVEYSGNNITHWSFLEDEDEHPNINVERLCSKLFLVTDSDSTKAKVDSKKAKRIVKLKETLGDERFYCLTCSEIENLIPKEAIKKYILENENKDEGSIDFTIFDTRDFADKKLGKFIHDNVIVSKSYASDSGTISGKVNFCKKTIPHITDLTEEAEELCHRIYKFIQSCNPS